MDNNKYDVYSILGLVFAIVSLVNLSFIFAILGIVFSSISKNYNDSLKMNKVSLTLSIISLIVSLIISILLAVLLIIGFINIPLN